VNEQSRCCLYPPYEDKLRAALRRHEPGHRETKINGKERGTQITGFRDPSSRTSTTKRRRVKESEATEDEEGRQVT
jgi:hypothetical protein